MSAAIPVQALKAAFPHTIPVFAGYWFLGMAYGVFANASGFAAWYPIVMAMCIYGGSLEFLAVTMLAAPFAPVQTFLVALMVQARHLFYGIPLLSRYEGLGWKKPLLVFWLSDETFAVNLSAKVPEGIDRGWFYLWVSGLDWAYWVSGAATGALFGALLHFDTTGLEFVMTAMFVVIFLEQWLSERTHWTALVGFVSSVGCLLAFGRDYFLVPTLCVMLVALTALRKPLEPRLGAGESRK